MWPMKDTALSKVRTKIFADGADLEMIARLAAQPLVKGFTTNPTLMRRSGVTDYRAFTRQVLEIVGERPISFGVLADEPGEIRRQAFEIGRLARNVNVKIPITTTDGTWLLEVIREVSHAGIHVNATAVMTIEQVMSACGALKGGAPSFISVFAGRIADTGRDPVPLMESAAALCREAGPGIELIWTSPREVLNLFQADRVGADVITFPPNLLEKLALVGKDLNVFSRETVLGFKQDGLLAGYKL